MRRGLLRENGVRRETPAHISQPSDIAPVIARNKDHIMNIIPVVFLATLAMLSSVYGQQPPLTIVPLTGGCHIYTTYHPVNGVPFPSNSMYVVTDSGVVMIDTPWDTEQVAPLLDSIERRHGMPVVMCLATHFHDDRTGGFDILKSRGIPTWSSVQTARLCTEHGNPVAAFTFMRDTTFSVGGMEFRTFYPGRGHTHDNIVVWFPAEKVLYGGCFVKSTEAAGLGNLEDADVRQWPGSVKKVMKNFPDRAFVIPGHQSWESPEGLEHTLELLREDARRKRR